MKATIVNKMNVNLPGAGSDFLAANVTPPRKGTLKIYFMAAVAGVLTVRRKQGGVTQSETMYDGSTLTANSAYEFDVEYAGSQEFNFRFSGTSGKYTLIVNAEY